MQPSYIPTQDSLLRAWALNFLTLTSATPAMYDLSVPDAANIATVSNAFIDAYDISINPSTKTAPTIADKDAAKAAMLVIVRPYAIQIRNNLGVSNEDKLGLGLNVPDTGKTPIPPPSTHPILAIIAATQGAHTLRFADSNTPDKRARPMGVAGLQVWRVIAEAPVMAPTGALFMGLVTRQPFASAFDASQNGQTCTYFGRWQNAKGEFGPWSAPVSMTIVA